MKANKEARHENKHNIRVPFKMYFSPIISVSIWQRHVVRKRNIPFSCAEEKSKGSEIPKHKTV